MNSRVPLIVAVLLAMFALGFAGSRLVSSVPNPPPPAHASLPPALASYLGTFEPGAPPDYDVVASFGRMAGRQPNLVGFYSGWTAPFDMAYAKTLQAHGVIPFVQIDPTATSINGIANGTYDDYLRSYADSVRNFRTAVIIGFGHEMNASWYPWGYKHVLAATFVGAWRHIVTLFRQEGAENVTWLWTLQAHGVVPFVQIDPTASSINGIANGTYDDYLRSYADSVRDFRHAVIIGFGHEMNASWYPWGYKHVLAATFVGAWRHIVTLFRQEGAENVTWLWTLQADEPGTGPIASWWPGANYVTWVGIDGYYYRPADTFTSVFGTTINQVRTFTSKPVLLSETAVGPAVGSAADQIAKIQDLFHGMA